MDAVIAWVDGSDPAHALKRRSFSADSKSLPSTASSDTRYASSDEVYYCIASIIKFAPYIDKIWLVTDNQTPPGLTEFLKSMKVDENRVTVVDHKILFRGFEAFLPTFNSMSISSVLWRIPGIADEFVYFNDDVFLCRPTSPDEFFLNGKAVVYTDYVEQHSNSIYRKIRFAVGHLIRGLRKPITMAGASCNAAKILNLSGDVAVPRHHPHPFLRKPIEEFFKNNDAILRKQVSHRFRQPSQFLSSALFYGLMQQQDLTVSKSVEASTYISFVGSEQQLRSKILDVSKGLTPFGCVQSLDLAKPRDRKAVQQMFCDLLNVDPPSSVA